GRLQLDSVTGRERAVAANDADGEQAASMHDQCAPGSLVDDETADRGLRIAKPELECAAAVDGGRGKARASTFPGDDPAAHLAAPAGSDHRRDAGRGGESRGGDLAGHPPAPQRAPSTENCI